MCLKETFGILPSNVHCELCDFCHIQGYELHIVDSLEEYE